MKEIAMGAMQRARLLVMAIYQAIERLVSE